MRFLGCVYLGVFLISHSASFGLADTRTNRIVEAIDSVSSFELDIELYNIKANTASHVARLRADMNYAVTLIASQDAELESRFMVAKDYKMGRERCKQTFVARDYCHDFSSLDGENRLFTGALQSKLSPMDQKDNKAWLGGSRSGITEFVFSSILLREVQLHRHCRSRELPEFLANTKKLAYDNVSSRQIGLKLPIPGRCGQESIGSVMNIDASEGNLRFDAQSFRPVSLSLQYADHKIGTQLFDEFIQYEALGYSEEHPNCIGVPAYTLSTLVQHKPGSKEPLGVIGSLAVVRVKSINKEIPKSTFELRFKENQTVLKFDPATLKTTVYLCQNGKLIPIDNVQQMQAYEKQSVRSGNRVLSVLLGGGALVAVVVALVVYRRLR